MMMASMSDREKRLAIITGSVLAIVLLYTAVTRLGGGAESTVAGNTPEFSDLYEKINSVEAQKQKNQVYRKRIGNQTGRFVEQKEMYQILAAIESVAGQSGLNLKGQDPQFNKRATPLPRLDVNINAECRFENLVQFLDNLRKGDYVIQPTNLKVGLKEKDKPELNVQMTLSTYLLDVPAVAPAANLSIAQGES